MEPFSDHNPLSIKVKGVADTEPKPFWFYNYLAENSNFLHVVETCWKEGNQLL